MKNIDQIRAMNAMAANDRIKDQVSKGRGDRGGDALTGFPALIINNGLLATIAFSLSKSNKEVSGHEVICNEIAQHLASPGIELVESSTKDAAALVKYLTSHQSTTLRICTAETLAFLNYLRRFAKVGGVDGNGGVE